MHLLQGFCSTEWSTPNQAVIELADSRPLDVERLTQLERSGSLPEEDFNKDHEHSQRVTVSALGDNPAITADGVREPSSSARAESSVVNDEAQEPLVADNPEDPALGELEPGGIVARLVEEAAEPVKPRDPFGSIAAVTKSLRLALDADCHLIWNKPLYAPSPEILENSGVWITPSRGWTDDHCQQLLAIWDAMVWPPFKHAVAGIEQDNDWGLALAYNATVQVRMVTLLPINGDFINFIIFVNNRHLPCGTKEWIDTCAEQQFPIHYCQATSEILDQYHRRFAAQPVNQQQFVVVCNLLIEIVGSWSEPLNSRPYTGYHFQCRKLKHRILRQCLSNYHQTPTIF